MHVGGDVYIVWEARGLNSDGVMQTHVAGLLPSTSGSYRVWLLELLKFSSRLDFNRLTSGAAQYLRLRPTSMRKEDRICLFIHASRIMTNPHQSCTYTQALHAMLLFQV